MKKNAYIKILVMILFFIIYGNVFSQTSVNSSAADTSKISKTTDSNPIVESYKENFSKNGDITRIFSISKILWAIFFFLMGFYFIKLVTSLLNKISETSTNYRLTLKGVIPIFRIISWTLTISFIIIGIFRPPIQSVIVVTGSLGIAVGFAAQDIFKNIFGGIMILFDRPFQVGDKIEIGEHYGEVMNIGLRSTRIATPDDSMVTVPNGELMAKSISNANSGQTHCQVVAELYLPVYIDTEKVRNLAIQAAQVSRYIYLNKPISVIFKNEFFQNRSVLKMRLKAYVLDIRYEFPFMSEMTETTIKELITQNLITKEELNGIVTVAN